MATASKVLIIVSRDFGELTNALNFARSPGLQVLLLLPENLYQNSQALPGVARKLYRNLDEVESTVTAEQPDVVMLFSGYLFVVSRLFEFAAFERWLDSMQRQGVLLMTSDPFLGMLHSDVNATFKAGHPARDWLAQHFTRVANRLRNVIHVYTAPCGEIGSSSKTSYGQPGSLLREASKLSRKYRLGHANFPLAEDNFWLFVLSTEDFEVQTRQLGTPHFIELLTGRMSEADKAGRVPVLIAPAACVEAVQTAPAPGKPPLAIPFCDHQRFEDLMLGAEYVFYWNCASNSILLRLVNALPVWFFDQGHLLRMLPDLQAIALETFFGGYGVQGLDLNLPLDVRSLRHCAASTHPARVALATRYLTLNTPAELIRRALTRQLLIEGAETLERLPQSTV